METNKKIKELIDFRNLSLMEAIVLGSFMLALSKIVICYE